LSEPGFGDLWIFARVYCLNWAFTGFFDLRIFERIHCLNLDLGGFMDFCARLLFELGFYGIF